MTSVRPAYLEAADYAVALLHGPAVSARWDEASALAELTVGALAGHLARQFFSVRQQLADSADHGEPIGLLEHYARSAWVDAGLHDAANVAMRASSEHDAAAGPAALIDRAAADVTELRTRLAAEPADRAVFLPWGPWSLTSTTCCGPG